MSWGAGLFSKAVELMGTMPWWLWIVAGLAVLYGIALAIWKHFKDQGAL